MEPIIMKGKPVADSYKEKYSARAHAMAVEGHPAKLAILTVGEDPASMVYRKRLIKTAENVEIESSCYELPETASTKEVLETIKKLNDDKAITGILPMMPMPSHIDADAVGAAIKAEKDVDCLNPFNCGELLLGKGEKAACTPEACLAILKYYGIEMDGKNAVVLGRSNVVGKPVALLLLKENCTVTVCHSHTRNLEAILKEADIIVAAIGKAHFVKASMVKEGAVIVDVGINVTDEGLAGDVAPEACLKASAYTPVPGGVGVVSNTMVMSSCL